MTALFGSRTNTLFTKTIQNACWCALPGNVDGFEEKKFLHPNSASCDAILSIFDCWRIDWSGEFEKEFRGQWSGKLTVLACCFLSRLMNEWHILASRERKRKRKGKRREKRKRNHFNPIRSVLGHAGFTNKPNVVIGRQGVEECFLGLGSWGGHVVSCDWSWKRKVEGVHYILPSFQNKSYGWTWTALRNKSYVWWNFSQTSPNELECCHKHVLMLLLMNYQVKQQFTLL